MARDYSGLQQLLREAAKTVADDQRSIIVNWQMFESTTPDIGASLVSVTKLEKNTKDKKRQRGYSFPSLPRYGSGKMHDSIVAKKGANNTWTVGPATTGFTGLKAGVMQGVIPNDRRPVPPRPFIGVSKRAETKINGIVRKYSTLFVRDIQKDLSTDLLRSTRKVEIRFVVT